MAESQYWQILKAAQAAVMILPEFVGVSSAIRLRPFCSTEHGDRLPFACFSGSAERVGQLYRADRALIDYPVYLTVFTAKGPDLEGEEAMRLKLQRREAARHALWRPRLHPTQGLARYEPDPPWDFGGLDRAFDISVQMWVYSNDEPC